MSKLVFNIPDKDTPGFLRRTKQALEYKLELDQGFTSEVLDKVINFLANYVSEPVDRTEAIEALWDASESQIRELMSAIAGGGGETNPTP